MKKLLALSVVGLFVAGFAAPAFAELEQIKVEKIQEIMKKESDRSGFSGTSAAGRTNTTEAGNWFRDKLIGGFHFGPAGTGDKSTK